jgi:hypothetical protein
MPHDGIVEQQVQGFTDAPMPVLCNGFKLFPLRGIQPHADVARISFLLGMNFLHHGESLPRTNKKGYRPVEGQTAIPYMLRSTPESDKFGSRATGTLRIRGFLSGKDRLPPSSPVFPAFASYLRIILLDKKRAHEALATPPWPRRPLPSMMTRSRTEVNRFTGFLVRVHQLF